MKYVLKIFSLFLLAFSTCFSQYSKHDRDLVKTTFERTFDNEIELKYLHSNNEDSVKAALLSISQSGDTLFNTEIEKLNFGKYPVYICFALGEAGPSNGSNKYLLSELERNKNYSDLVYPILTALGKVGDENSFNKIVRLYPEYSNYFNGISIALLNFHGRKTGNNGLSLGILLNELQNYRKNSKRFFEAAFTIERIGVPYREIHIITDELSSIYSSKTSSNLADNYTSSAVACLLKTLTKTKYFPYNPELKAALLKANNFDIKVEAARAISYYNFTNLNDFIDYLRLLDNHNQNVAQVFAESLKNIKVNKFLSDFLKGFIQKGISNRKYSMAVKGELFLSYIGLYNPSFDEVIKKFSDKVSKDYLYRACLNYKDSQAAFEYLINNYSNSGLRKKIKILTALLKLQSKYNSNKKLVNIIENALSSDSPALISISADGIDSTIVKKEGNNLQNILIAQSKKYLNNPNYYESLESIAGLARRIDKQFYMSIITGLSKSEIYSVKKYAYSELSVKTDSLRIDSLSFNSYWTNAFKYKGALIKTEKGTFRISFLPRYAPISVGNFCLLIKNKFFNLTEFHRVIPGFVIQGGDPTATGWGGPGYDFVSELSPLYYKTGSVGMASAGKDTEGSQWFVTTGNFPHLNGKYTIFGTIETGQNVIDETVLGEKIISAALF